jgi:hypothetical protein
MTRSTEGAVAWLTRGKAAQRAVDDLIGRAKADALEKLVRPPVMGRLIIGRSGAIYTGREMG